MRARREKEREAEEREAEERREREDRERDLSGWVDRMRREHTVSNTFFMTCLYSELSSSAL